MPKQSVTGRPVQQCMRTAVAPPGGPTADVDEPDERRLREERILDAAAALLVRWGYRKTTIDDVAREAGVGKGTIYLHWKDKSALFQAAVLRAQQQTIDDIRQRIAADPEGGLPHRLWTHGLLAALGNPLMAAIMRGQTDVYPWLKDAYKPAALLQMTGDYAAYVVQMQSAGLIRSDLSVSVITFLTTALKIGIINAPEVLGAEQTPPLEELTEAISDLIRRWLEPEHLSGNDTEGKRHLIEWLDKVRAVEEHLQRGETS